jgi:hypothetical protein
MSVKDREVIKKELLNYLIIYLKNEKVKITDFLLSLIDQIESGKDLTINQFNSIINFIGREKDFRKMEHSAIREYFSLIIKERNDHRNEDRYELQTNQF